MVTMYHDTLEDASTMPRHFLHILLLM